MVENGHADPFRGKRLGAGIKDPVEHVYDQNDLRGPKSLHCGTHADAHTHTYLHGHKRYHTHIAAHIHTIMHRYVCL